MEESKITGTINMELCKYFKVSIAYDYICDGARLSGLNTVSPFSICVTCDKLLNFVGCLSFSIYKTIII